jgi:SPP1 gp7 family putative phage head morphogenesis protein
MPEAAPFNLPFDEAIEFFRAKGIQVSPDSWRDLWREANARAFTVARVTQMDVLADLKLAVDAAMSQGMSLGEFKSSVRPMLERKGWMAHSGEAATATLPDGTVRKRLTPWRVENIYRTNLQTAYSAGRWKQQEETAAFFPYLQYMAILDSRTRQAHAAMHGKVFHREHPVWERWYPPNGFACRCYVKSLTDGQVKARGLKVRKEGVDVAPDEGWDYHVGKAGLGKWQPDLSKYAPELSRQYLAKEKRPFVPAERLEDAIEWAQNEYAENVHLSAENKDRWGKTLSQSEALKKGNEINRAVHEMKERHPEFPLPKIRDVYWTADKRGRAMLTRAEEASITFADDWGEASWNGAKAFDRLKGRPWNWYEDETHIAYNVRHELAHVVDGHFGVQSDPEFLTLCGKYKLAWRKKHVSDYASTNNLEFFAELLAEYTSPVYEKYRKFPDDIVLFLRKVLGGIGRYGAAS